MLKRSMPVGNNINMKMEKKYYTSERNVQIMIYLLKAHGIKRVIASPGTTNMTFIGSIQQDPWFEIYSSVDERSAAYLACGMAAETGEPVVLSCTGATASRNYMPGLTEAYYRKLPVLALTSHRGDFRLGHLLDQQIDRRQSPSDIAVEKCVLPLVKDANDEFYCTIEANKAILALTQRGGGPVHVNMFTKYSPDFSIKQLPSARVIHRYTMANQLPEIAKNKKVAIFVGAHKHFSDSENTAIEAFCQTNNAVVFCDHTSGYRGRYAVHNALICAQRLADSSIRTMNILIHIGEVSGDAYGKGLKMQEVWRVNEDGAVRDSWGKLTNVFEMPEEAFFKAYSKGQNTDDSFLKQCLSEYQRLLNNLPELPFSNIWMASQMYDKIPQNSEVHFGIYNSLRAWNFFSLDTSIKTNCNVGGFGIDGGVSSLIGASICNPTKLYFGVFGDLAFFYDMNVLGNRHVGNNVRILLINNGKGNEFRLYSHPCSAFGEDADPFMAAAGHYGNKSPNLVKHYAEDLGYKYLSASNKEEFLMNLPSFLDTTDKSQPYLLEVFTETEEESKALEQILNFDVDTTTGLKRKIANRLQGTPVEGVINAVRKIIK